MKKFHEWFCIILLVVMLVVGFAGFFIGEKKGINTGRSQLVTGEVMCKPSGANDGVMQIQCKSKEDIMDTLNFIGGNDVEKQR